VSAMCSNTDWRAVKRRRLESDGPIDHGASDATGEAHVRPRSPRNAQMSESALALIAIRALLESQSPDLPPNPSRSGPALDRITIRPAAGRSACHPAPGC